MSAVFDFVMHLDRHLAELTAQYGALTYGLLFLIVFCETGLVVTPFLPGDSLLFAAGAVSALGSLHVMGIWGTLVAAAVLGDAANYWIGRRIGIQLLAHKRIVKPEHINRTHRFFERYGKSAIIIARFVPIVRTFVPFVAGLGSMTYRVFFTYNVVGGVLWVSLFVFGGYLFGNISWVKTHFEFVILAIIVLSVVPIIVEFLRHRRSARRALDPAP